MTRKPDWLKISLPQGEEYRKIRGLAKGNKLHTICESGRCPNLAECWGRGTATFMILGDICTRACKFCSVKSGKPLAVDYEEPKRLADSIKQMNLRHCVITSVDRDDLRDGGASFWAKTIREVKKENPNTTLETLIPDFDGKGELIDIVIAERPNIVSHNMETVRRLTPQVRSRAKYEVSLKTLKHIADSGVVKAKTGLMVGLGEKEEEVFETMDDILAAGCKILTIGQYLQPTRKQLQVVEYVTLEQFEKYKKVGLEKGFEFIESGPLVRSSYYAERHV